jgi:oligopeptidase B
MAILTWVVPHLWPAAIAPAADFPQPPIAAKIDHQETRWGQTVHDDYYWMRDKSDPKVIEYLNAENAYTDAVTAGLKPFQDALYKEMLGHVKQTDQSVPVRRGGYFYYSRTEEGKQYPIYCRKYGSVTAKEEVILDLNDLGKGKKFVGIGKFELSDDQKLLAYTIDYVGYRQFTLQVKDLSTGITLADAAERVTSVAWAADNKTLFYSTEDPASKRSNELWRHRLGQTASEPLFEEKDDVFRTFVTKTRDKQYLISVSVSTDTSECRYLRADQPGEQFTVFLPRQRQHRYFVDHRAGLFYIRSNEGATNFQIFTVTEANPAREHWKVFLAHDPATLIQDFDLFQDFAVSFEKKDALNRLHIYNFKQGNWSFVTFPEPVYAALPAENPDYAARAYRYTYQSMVTPASTFEYDVPSAKSKLLKRQEVPNYDPAQYVTERQWVTVRDGTRVPLSIVYKKGFARDGARPLLLYAYGAYGVGQSASFAATRLVLLDRGFAFVLAHIRGGDDLGEAWHDNGKLLNKKNTFNDFVDCAEYLEKERWTTKERLLIEGGSAGGLLMGAVVNQRPDLFRAVHLAVPFVDVMNDMMDPSLPLTTTDYPEWGNPSESRAVYDYILSYSPYDNARKTDYPPMLLTESLHDSQVAYWEAAKFTAKVRALKTSRSVILLKMKMDPAGHGGASGRYDALRDRAFECSWMMSQVGVTQ